MDYEKGLRVTQDERADFRGPFGFGRRAHGSDPHAYYQFCPPPRPLVVSTISKEGLPEEK